MSNRLKKHVHVLCVLCKNNVKINKAIIKEADKELIYCLCECAKNVLNGNVKLSKSQLVALKKHGNNVRSLVKKTVGIKKKKQVLQRGGLLSALLAPLAAQVLMPVLSKILKK